MQLPDYWLPRPPFTLSDGQRAACDRLFETILAHQAAPMAIDDDVLPLPKWQFLCYLADQDRVAFHGSGNPSIRRFEPRQPVDLRAFSSQRAVYAASDGLWPMYFAILDRPRIPTLLNACIRLEPSPGQTLGPFYLFSVSQQALLTRPWQRGTVYLLPRSAFTQEPSFFWQGVTVHSTQLVSLTPVTPLALLSITPEDFPFLGQIRGHEDARLAEYAAAMGSGAPWPA